MKKSKYHVSSYTPEMGWCCEYDGNDAKKAESAYKHSCKIYGKSNVSFDKLNETVKFDADIIRSTLGKNDTLPQMEVPTPPYALPLVKCPMAHDVSFDGDICSVCKYENDSMSCNGLYSWHMIMDDATHFHWEAGFPCQKEQTIKVK